MNIIEVVHESDWTKAIVDAKVIAMNNVVKSQNPGLKGKPLLGGTTKNITPSFYWTPRKNFNHRKYKVNKYFRNLFDMNTSIRFHRFWNLDNIKNAIMKKRGFCNLPYNWIFQLQGSFATPYISTPWVASNKLHQLPSTHHIHICNYILLEIWQLHVTMCNLLHLSYPHKFLA